jgi:hypothetical protein
MFSCISLEERVPQAHPLRKLRTMVDALLATMNREFAAGYARRGRPSVPPKMLLKALLLQILHPIRSERQLVEAVKHAAVDARIRRHEGYNTSQKVRKRVEKAFSWAKTVDGLTKTQLIGHAKLTGQALLCFATYNLVRMDHLGGRWDAHHA